MDNSTKAAGQPFKSLRDYILWELKSGHDAARLMSLDDDPESTAGVTRLLRGKMRYLSAFQDQKRT